MGKREIRQDNSNYFDIVDYSQYLYVRHLETRRKNLQKKILQMAHLKSDVLFFQSIGTRIERGVWDVEFVVKKDRVIFTLFTNAENLVNLKIRVSFEEWKKIPPASQVKLVIESLKQFISEIDARISFLNSPINQ